MDIPIRFAHTDPAGMVFYPRYFEMVNQVVEDWFAGELGVDFATLHGGRGLGVPTVRLECQFLKPSRLGDVVRFGLEVEKIGHSSFTLAIAGSTGDERKLEVRTTLVFVGRESMNSHPIPGDIRERMAAFQQ